MFWEIMVAQFIIMMYHFLQHMVIFQLVMNLSFIALKEVFSHLRPVEGDCIP